jgi:hypothetical protein
MKYSLIFFFVLFAINNLLHYISERVIIVIFIVFLYFLMKFLSTAINSEFKAKIDYILNDINMYMNVVFNFLYINKLFYLNLKALRENFISVNHILVKKLNHLNSQILLNKIIKSNRTVTFFN